MLTLDDFHPYQHNATDMLYEHAGMLGVMPTGAGKTAVGLTAFSELQRDGFVRKGVLLAPKRVALSVWPHEPLKWAHLVHLKVRALTGPPKKRWESLWCAHTDLYALGINNIVWLLEACADWDDDDPRFDILIVDESSRVKNPRGTWAKTLRKLAKKFKTVWLLTGTPRPNSEQDYFVPMAVVSSDKLWGRSFDKWRRTNFFPVDFEQRQWAIHQSAQEKINRDVARYSFKVPLSEVPRPASDPIVHKVTLPPKARIHYKKMERDLFTTLEHVDITAFSTAVSTGKLAQIAQGFIYDDKAIARSVHHAKIEMLEHLLADMQGDAAALVYWFKEDLVRLRDVVPGLVWLGDGVSDKRSAEIEDDWNAGNIEHLALHPASAGHGLNLQGTQAQLIHYALTWSAELYEQVVARVARQGYVRKKKEWVVLNHHIVADGTVDDIKMRRVSEKLTAQQAAVEYLKSV